MKLNSFGETIRRIEAERLEQARQAVANGWTEADHPDKCCPVEIIVHPRSTGRTLFEVQRLHDKAINKRKWWEDALKRREQALANHEATVPKFDHGMMQLSLKYRQQGLSKGQRLWREVEEAKSKVAHFTQLTKKYQDQIDKRS